MESQQVHQPPDGLTKEKINKMGLLELFESADRFDPPLITDACSTIEQVREIVQCAYYKYHDENAIMDRLKVGQNLFKGKAFS